MLIFCLFWSCRVLVMCVVLCFGLVFNSFSCNDFCLSFKMRERISSFVMTIKHNLKDHSLGVIARFFEFINWETKWIIQNKWLSWQTYPPAFLIFSLGRSYCCHRCLYESRYHCFQLRLSFRVSSCPPRALRNVIAPHFSLFFFLVDILVLFFDLSFWV